METDIIISSPENVENLETINERVHRHLTDISSEITDEDLKTVRIGLEVEDPTYLIFFSGELRLFTSIIFIPIFYTFQFVDIKNKYRNYHY